MPKTARSFLLKLGAIALIIYIVWLGWQSLGPRKPDVGAARREMARKIIPSIVTDLRDARVDNQKTALLHFENDTTAYFTDSIRALIEGSGVIYLRDKTFAERLADRLNLGRKTYGSLDAALKRGRALNVDAVIFGEVHAFESLAGKGEVDVEVYMADVESGEVIFSRRYSSESSSLAAVAADIERRAGAFPWFTRLFGWTLIMLLLPVFTIGFIRTVVARESNATNAFALCVYTLADGILALIMLGAIISTSIWMLAFFILLIIIAFLYNLKVMSYAAKLEEA